MTQQLQHIEYVENLPESTDFSIRKKYITPDLLPPLHWHDYLEFECVVSGTAVHQCNGNTYPIVRGDAHLMGYYDFHTLTEPQELVLYCVQIRESLLAPSLVNDLVGKHLQCHFEEDDFCIMLTWLDIILEESKKKSPYNSLIIKNALNCVVALMLRVAVPDVGRTTSLPIQQSIQYIQAHYAEDLTLRSLAQQLNYSPNYLGHLFSTQLGYSFHEYLHILRLKYAQTLLQTTNMTSEEIAAASGYHSTEYFLAVFKKKTGISPSAYRAKLKQQ